VCVCVCVCVCACVCVWDMWQTDGPARRYWLFAAWPAVSSRCEQCHVVSWRRKLSLDCCIVFAGVRAGSAKVDCCLIRLHRCTYVLLDCSALLLYRNVRRKLWKFDYELKYEMVHPAHTQKRPLDFGWRDNAPLLPEAKKILKIWLRNGAFWSIYLNKYVASIAPFSTPAFPDCSQIIT